MPMTDDKMMLAGKALVQTMMRSASIAKIRPIDWWSRARTALEGAARSSNRYSELVSKMASKLQIDSVSATTAQDLAFLADEVPAADFPTFRRFLEREAIYVVAMAQADAKEKKEARKRDGDGTIHPSGIDTIQDAYDLAASNKDNS